MNFIAQVLGCSGVVTISYTSIAGTYDVSVDGVVQSSTLTTTNNSDTLTFALNQPPGTTLNCYIEPNGIPNCRIDFTVDVPECNPVITSECVPGEECDCELCKAEETTRVFVSTGPNPNEREVVIEQNNAYVGIEETVSNQASSGFGSALITVPFPQTVYNFVLTANDAPCYYIGGLTTSLANIDSLDQFEILPLQCGCTEDIDPSYTITVGGDCGEILASVASGPGVANGNIITGADATTTFDYTSSTGCGDTGLGLGDTADNTLCSGGITTCGMFHDFGITTSGVTAAQNSITSLIIDGVEYVTTPVSLNTNLIAVGTLEYNTAFADAINSLGVPNFYADYPSEAQLLISHALATLASDRNAISYLSYPDCVSFTLTAVGPRGTYTWTESGYNPPFAMGNYGVLNTFDCSASNTCP